jgi:hypothetical protein
MDPDSTTPPSEDELPPVDLPGFEPPTRPTLDQLDPNQTTVTPASPTMDPLTDHLTDPPPISDLEDELGERVEAAASTQTTTSRRSAGDPSIAAAAAGLFALAASLIGFVLDKTIGRDSGAYLMHEAEADAIGTPLGRIASRRAPIGDGDVTDISDGIQAGVASAAYAARATVQHFSTAPMPPPEAMVQP